MSARVSRSNTIYILKPYLKPREAEKGFGDEIPKQVWDRSLPPSVTEAGRRSVGNRKERLRDYASSPDQYPLQGYGDSVPIKKIANRTIPVTYIDKMNVRKHT